MATTVRTSAAIASVNSAFLQEIKDVNAELGELLERLRKVCRTAASVRTQASQLVEMLLELRDQLALHFALEEAFGYFEDPAVVVPSLFVHASALRAEHRSLYSQSGSLADHADLLWSEGNLADFVTRIPVEFWEFDHRLRLHESNENELIMRQFDDVGVGD
jgi:hypothetical protein